MRGRLSYIEPCSTSKRLCITAADGKDVNRIAEKDPDGASYDLERIEATLGKKIPGMPKAWECAKPEPPALDRRVCAPEPEK